MGLRPIAKFAAIGACLTTGAFLFQAFNNRHLRAAVRTIKQHELEVSQDTFDSLNQMVDVRATKQMDHIRQGQSVAFVRKNCFFGTKIVAYHKSGDPIVDHFNRCLKQRWDYPDFMHLPSCAEPLHRAEQQWKRDKRM